MDNQRYYSGGSGRYQKGHGLASIFTKFAIPALKRMAPIIGRQIKRHAPKIGRTLGKTALKTLKSKNKKATLQRELSKAVQKEFSRRRPTRGPSLRVPHPKQFLGPQAFPKRRRKRGKRALNRQKAKSFNNDIFSQV